MKVKILLSFLFLTAFFPAGGSCNVPTTVLYHKVFGAGQPTDIVLDGVKAAYTDEGLKITGTDGYVKLDRYYSLSERMVRYHVRLSHDARAVFRSDTGDFNVCLDMTAKTVTIDSRPVTGKYMEFLDPDHEYLVEIYKIYQLARVRIVDVFTGESDQIELTFDGPGGHGAGVVNRGMQFGMQKDHYCFGLLEGESLLVKQVTVKALQCDYTLLIYGASISETEGYFPAADYPDSWTRLVMGNISGRAASSGRGGCTVKEVMERIVNELPYVKSKYVMVTIGTNGGNTEENLSELVEYIISQGSIPILNNIPANESGTQVEVNELIAAVRDKYGIAGCRFDLPTSIGRAGLEVDRSTMYYEDYSDSYGWHIYHHPNVKGSMLMYIQTLIDIPWIYE